MAVQPVQLNMIRRLIQTFQSMPVEQKRTTIELLQPIIELPPETIPKPKREYRNPLTLHCWVCGKEFSAVTSKARTCSQSCRSKLFYSRKQIQKRQEKILWAIGDLQDMTIDHDPVLVRKARQTLFDIREQIQQACKESRV